MSPTAPASERLNHLDAARAAFMLLGIPFHAALPFAGGPWLVRSGDHDPFLSLLVPALSDFRMPGFFVIAGFFAALLIDRRGTRAWLRSRIERLGVPLLVGMAVLVAPQTALLAALASAQVAGPGDLGNALVSHLWFLPVLLALCAATAFGWRFLARIRWRDTPTVALAAALTVYELALRALESPIVRLLEPLHGLFDIYRLLMFAPFFLFGIAACRSQAVRERLFRFDPAIAGAGIVALALHLALWQPQTTFEVAADLAGDAFASVCLTQSLLALFARVFDRPNAAVRRLVDASFTIYLVHHPIVVVLAVASLGVALPAVCKWAAICVATLILSYGAHCLIATNPLLLWLFNGIRPPKPGQAPAIA